MKRWILCLMAFLAMSFFGLWPFRREDAGNLYIADTLLVEADRTGVTLSTGDLTAGGPTVRSALEALSESAPGQLFLRQAKRVIFCGGAEQSCEPLSLPDQLPMGACVYRSNLAASELDLETLSPVLDARERRSRDLPTLAALENAVLSGGEAELAELEVPHADP